MAYVEDDYLALSGIQHFAFCRRQWALIHMEASWEDDSRTASGKVFHENVDSGHGTRRGTVFTARGIAVSSSELGLSGRCDAVEFEEDLSGVTVDGMDGLYRVTPVEYKVGRRKVGDWDRLQLCAEAMALEESLHTRVSSGALFYGTERRREAVDIDGPLRERVRTLAAEMHRVFDSRAVPAPEPIPACRSCSLLNLCMPYAGSGRSVSDYMRRMEAER